MNMLCSRSALVGCTDERGVLIEVQKDGVKLSVVDLDTMDWTGASVLLPADLITFQAWLGAYHLESFAEFVLSVAKAIESRIPPE